MANRKRLVMVRHGETVGNSSIRYYGRTDLELSELGRAQMRAVAIALAAQFGPGAPFSPIISSPFRRAREGARIICGDDARLDEIEEFREVDFGDFEGLTADEIAARFPDEFARWNRDRLAPSFTYPHGESRAGFTARVERGLARMLPLLDAPAARNAPAQEQPALLVAHRGVLRTIARRLTGVAPLIELGSIQIFARDGDSRWRVELLDATTHLVGLT
ncbi:MAG TPA: histidine phosphatase family protein [Candidatus Binataceae bacterium]|nr:histidine phosphatase family protein [Candidatus Binataceae bacterium]